MDDQKTTFSYHFTADTQKAQSEIKQLSNAADLLSNKVVSALDQIAIKGRDVDDVFKSLALNIGKKALRSAVSPLEKSIGQGFGFDAGGLFQSILGFAKGGVVSGGIGGGVVNSPIGFPMGGGQLGIAGEAGPEAIMPLARGPNGELGVRAGNQPPMTITINISTPDIESFRRSEGEIAAQMQRLVSRGNRNL